MLKSTFTILILASLSLTGRAAEQSSPNMRHQVTLMAAMMDGMCHAREQGGTTLTATAQANLTPEEKDQCAYVRMGLRNGCFEHGDCPAFERWRRAGKSAN